MEFRRVRFRSPPIRSIQNAEQPVLLLGARSKLDEHRAQHRHAEGNDSRRVGERDFLVEYMRLCGGPPWAAVFGRPMARQPTALMKNGMTLFMLLFGQSFASAHFVSDSSRDRKSTRLHSSH